MGRQILLITTMVLMSTASQVLAQQIVDPEAEMPAIDNMPATILEEDQEGGLSSLFSKLDKTQTSISSGIEKTVGSIDSFFADDKMFEQTNQSYMRLSLDMVHKEYEGTGFAGDLKLKADLPRTKKRLKLLIETDSQRDSKDNLNELPRDVVQERDFLVSLEKQVGNEQKWDIRNSMGIKVHTPLDPFARSRAYRNFSFNKWLLQASTNFEWFDSRGFGTNGTLEFNRALSKNFLFRSTSTLSWQEEDVFRRFDQGLSIYQNIDERQNLAYQIAGFANDENDWLATQYYIRVRYRKALYKKWMFGEIIPQWDFNKETGFHSQPSLTFRLEMAFGKNYR